MAIIIFLFEISILRFFRVAPSVGANFSRFTIISYSSHKEPKALLKVGTSYKKRTNKEACNH